MFLAEIAAFFVAYAFAPYVILGLFLLYWTCLSDAYDSFPVVSYGIAVGGIAYLHYSGMMAVSIGPIMVYILSAIIIALVQIRVFDMRKVKQLIDKAITNGYVSSNEYGHYKYRWFTLTGSKQTISQQIEIVSLSWYLGKYIMLAPVVLIDIIIGSFLRDLWYNLVDYTKRKVRAPIERYLEQAIRSATE